MSPGDGPPQEGSAAEAEKIRFCVANRERLRRFAAKWLAICGVPGSRLSDEDVAQHAIAEVLGRWSTVRQPERYGFTVARRYIYQARREDARFTGSLPTDPDAEPAGPHTVLDQMACRAPWVSVAKLPDPVQAYNERELADEINAAMQSAGLSGMQREAIEWTFRKDRSRAEMAGCLGMAENTVSSHLHRAKTKLKPVLEALGRAALVLLVLLGLLAGGVGTAVAVAQVLEDPSWAALPTAALLIKAVIDLWIQAENDLRPRAAVSRRGQPRRPSGRPGSIRLGRPRRHW
ncbi:RNA polymerase sigma factor, sigma-70 family [Micromonospora pallida]|uniref:RNA polymerase sigma factor, sigma-70 family n=1 Tax=Micromonospora pallida TaxID=145854 RepID=A0A1C6SEJ9_9ACTN|nr:RNA polymerase sigma factor, sigma-70 family [Micromonospora pallida]